jgi:hypothetical protein
MYLRTEQKARTERERAQSLDGVTAAAPEGRIVERPSAFGVKKSTAAGPLMRPRR